MSVYGHFPLALIRPDFDDPLTDLIIELDHQRNFVLSGTTPPEMFFQLKRLFHILESLGSARIENNRTTVAHSAEGMASIKLITRARGSSSLWISA